MYADSLSLTIAGDSDIQCITTSGTSSCGCFTVTYNNIIFDSTLVFESESLCVECENGNNFPDIVNRIMSTCIHDPGMINNNYLYNNVYHM